MKKRVFNFALFNLIILILVFFSIYILNNTTINYKIGLNQLEGTVKCPKKMDLNNDLRIDNNDLVYLNTIIDNATGSNLEIDLNGDKILDKLDYNIYFSCLSKYDFNGDKLVDCSDFNVLNNNVIKNSGVQSEDNTIYDLNNDSTLSQSDTIAFLNILSKSGINNCYDLYYDNIFILNNDEINVDSENKIISRIRPGLKVTELLGMITVDDTDVNVLDSIDTLKDDNEILKTGDKIVFKSNNSNNEVTYTLSVLGDVLGTGIISIDSAKKIAQHIVDKDIFVTENSAVILSADYNNDGIIKMNDVILLVESIENNE